MNRLPNTHFPRIKWIAALILVAMVALGIVSRGGAITLAQPEAARTFNPSAVNLEPGYSIEPVLANLSVPVTVIFDGDDILIAETGYINTAPARILRFRPSDGTVTELASAGLEPPVNGIAMLDGQLYVSHKNRVSIVQPDKTLTDIVTGLPSDGDHQNNQLALGPDGKIYLGQGTVTNSAVVGIDNAWIKELPTVTEIPCRDITLVGQNFETENFLTDDPNDTALTGAYKPFGVQAAAGQAIPGNPKCGGSIVRFNPDGSDFELVADGLRNPFGVKFDADGNLWASWHGSDIRGSRNIFNDPDYLAKIEQGAWYGWPEFFNDKPVTSPEFKDPTKPQPEFLWQEHPPLTEAFYKYAPHAGAGGIAFSPGGAFGLEGEIFAAEFGAYVPVTTGVNVTPTGYRVIRINSQTAEAQSFIANKLPGPSYVNRGGGLDRPADITFGPDESMYLLDWGSSQVDGEGLKLVPLTGMLLRIYKQDTQQPLYPNGPIGVVPPPQVPQSERGVEVAPSPETLSQLAGPLGFLLVGLLIVIAGAIFVVRRLRH
jgi:glucose/arabinose dehydrogenase